MNSHFAKDDKSERLKRTLKWLKAAKDRNWIMSTREIQQHACVCAVNTVIHELRCNGYDIECTRKGRLYYYELKG